MSDFIIRVVLHNADAADYMKLQQALAAFGVVDVIKAADGNLYKLPPAEYCYTGNETPEIVRQGCVNIANSIGRQCAVLVTQASHVVWQGLTVVR